METILENIDTGWKYLFRNKYGHLVLTIDVPVYYQGDMVTWYGNSFDFSCFDHLFEDLRGGVYICLNTYRKEGPNGYYRKFPQKY